MLSFFHRKPRDRVQQVVTDCIHRWLSVPGTGRTLQRRGKGRAAEGKGEIPAAGSCPGLRGLGLLGKELPPEPLPPSQHRQPAGFPELFHQLLPAFSLPFPPRLIPFPGSPFPSLTFVSVIISPSSFFSSSHPKSHFLNSSQKPPTA